MKLLNEQISILTVSFTVLPLPFHTNTPLITGHNSCVCVWILSWKFIKQVAPSPKYSMLLTAPCLLLRMQQSLPQ